MNQHTNTYDMNKLKSITSFISMNSAEFEKLMDIHTTHESIPINTTKCQYCDDDSSIIQDMYEGIIVCKNCGQVMDYGIFDHAPEWKTFDDGGSLGRCGMQTSNLLPVSSMSTTIRGSCNQRLKTMQTWSSMPPKERSLNNDLNIIRDKCKQKGLHGYIEDTAKQLYKIASEHTNKQKQKKIIRGKNREGLLAASVFYACKQGKKPISLKEIAKLFQIKTASVNKGCKIFREGVRYMGIDYGTNMIFPSNYIHLYCDKLKLSRAIEDFCMGVAKYVEGNNLIQAHTPISIASACILYGVSKKLPEQKYDKSSIAKLFNMSETTVIKTYEELVKHEEHFPDAKQEYEPTGSLVITKSLNIEKKYDAQQMTMIKKRDGAMKLNLSQFHNSIVMPIEQFLSYSMPKYMSDCSNGCSEDCKKYVDYIEKL